MRFSTVLKIAVITSLAFMSFNIFVGIQNLFIGHYMWMIVNFVCAVVCYWCYSINYDNWKSALARENWRTR